MKNFDLENYNIEDGILTSAEATVNEQNYTVTKTDEPGIISTIDGYKAVYEVENLDDLRSAQVKLPLETSDEQLDPESAVERILERSRFKFSDSDGLDDLLEY